MSPLVAFGCLPMPVRYSHRQRHVLRGQASPSAIRGSGLALAYAFVLLLSAIVPLVFRSPASSRSMSLQICRRNYEDCARFESERKGLASRPLHSRLNRVCVSKLKPPFLDHTVWTIVSRRRVCRTTSSAASLGARVHSNGLRHIDTRCPRYVSAESLRFLKRARLV